MRFQILCFTAAATLLAAPAFAQTAPDAASAPAASTAAPADSTTTAPVASTAAPTDQHYTTDTTPLGDMLDDPAAKAVLVAHLPNMMSNPQLDMGRGMTLRSLQAYAPDLSDAVLAAIDADLAKLPAK